MGRVFRQLVMRKRVWGLACLLLFVWPAEAQSPFRVPVGVAFDSAGNLFVADAGRQQVLEVSLGGAVSVVAGTGVQGFGGDGGAATAALLNAPSAVAIGTDGTLYIADAGNQRVRAVNGGVISTFAGSGVRGVGGDGGSALAATFSGPVGLAVDRSGGLLIADSGNHRVRRVLSGVVTTFAGTGIQGLGGDGGPATLAVLDTPSAIAVASDGRVFVADMRNNRVRVIGTDGVIQTFAGNGFAGFGGDGGSALSAAMYAPTGLAVSASGMVVFADSGNHRVRIVNASGVVSTLVGSGVQGAAANEAMAATSAVDTPVATAVSSTGDVVFADAANAQVIENAPDGTLRVIGVGTAVTNLSLAPVGTLTYGGGSVTVILMTTGSVAEGNVSLLESGQSVSSGPLTSDAAVLSTASLTAGTHSLSAAYGGDLLHGAAMSPAIGVSIAPLALVATAAGASVTYGSALPALNGSLTGVLARDVASVTAEFSSSAVDLAPVGLYPISAMLTGAASGNYTVTMSAASGVLQVVQARPAVSLTTQGNYAGLPILLNATIASPTRGVPTGMVQFVDAGVAVASAALVNGSASAVYLNPAAGTRSLTAVYVGDRNFAAALSSVSSVVVGALPDFAIASSGSASQTVQGGGIATYALLVTPQPAPFSGSVVFSAAGLQPGAKVSFSPASVVPGSGPVPLTMSIQTVELSGLNGRSAGLLRFAAVLSGLLLLSRKRRSAVGLLCVLLAVIGCGTRTTADASGHAAQTFNIAVTATSTNLAGSVVTHTCTVTLTVE